MSMAARQTGHDAVQIAEAIVNGREFTLYNQGRPRRD